MKGIIHKTMMGWHIISEDIDMFPINGIPIDKHQYHLLSLSDLEKEVEFTMEQQEFYIYDYYKKEDCYEPKTITTYYAKIQG